MFFSRNGVKTFCGFRSLWMNLTRKSVKLSNELTLLSAAADNSKFGERKLLTSVEFLLFLFWNVECVYELLTVLFFGIESLRF